MTESETCFACNDEALYHILVIEIDTEIVVRSVPVCEYHLHSLGF